jgi:hypothetical protein
MKSDSFEIVTLSQMGVAACLELAERLSSAGMDTEYEGGGEENAARFAFESEPCERAGIWEESEIMDCLASMEIEWESLFVRTGGAVSFIRGQKGGIAV